jgi:hypothetical protein
MHVAAVLKDVLLVALSVYVYRWVQRVGLPRVHAHGAYVLCDTDRQPDIAGPPSRHNSYLVTA